MMSYADLFNGCLEFFGGFFLWRNVYQIMKDKAVRGVHWTPTLFFLIWGCWNLYYYPSLHQWFSFFGGINIVTANAFWFYFMFKYRKE